MKEINTVLAGGVVTKEARTKTGAVRLAHERRVYERLHGSPHIAEVIDTADHSLHLKEVEGINAKEWLEFSENWTCVPQEYGSALKKLGHYVTAEMNFIENGVMYRDLNLEHLIFTEDKAVLVDLEEAVLWQPDRGWYFESHRGTWETMALEEFPSYGTLTERTATYRVAVVAHLALTGHLPFPRKPVPLRASTYAWRRNHPPMINKSLPPQIKSLFSAALAREPSRRHKDPRSFLEGLERAATHI